MPVITEIMHVDKIDEVAKVTDIMQIELEICKTILC